MSKYVVPEAKDALKIKRPILTMMHYSVDAEECTF